MTFPAHHGDIAGDGGEPGQGDVLGIGALGVQELIKGELGAVELGVHAIVLGRQGVDLAEDADAVAATPHGGAAAGVVGGVGGRAGGTLKMDIYSPDVLENGLDGPLHGVEVHVLAVGAQGEYLGLVGQAMPSPPGR